MFRAILKLLDHLLLLFHALLILFVLFGWVFTGTRQAHLALTIVILFFWSVVGYFKGFGYCPLTNFHSWIKLKLGENPIDEYMKYLVDTIFNSDVNAGKIKKITETSFFAVLIITLFVNVYP